MCEKLSLLQILNFECKNEKSAVDTAKPLTILTGVKDLSQNFVIPGGLCVSQPRGALLKKVYAISRKEWDVSRRIG